MNGLRLGHDVAALFQRAENCRAKKTKGTYNSGDSLVVTHPTTNPPI